MHNIIILVIKYDQFDRTGIIPELTASISIRVKIIGRHLVFRTKHEMRSRDHNCRLDFQTPVYVSDGSALPLLSGQTWSVINRSPFPRP